MIAGEIENIMHSSHHSYYDPFFKKWKARRKKKKAEKQAAGKESIAGKVLKIPSLPARVLVTGAKQELVLPRQPQPAHQPEPKPMQVAKVMEPANKALEQMGGVKGAKESVQKIQQAAKAEMKDDAPADYDIGLGDPENKTADNNTSPISAAKIAAYVALGTLAVAGIVFAVVKLRPAAPTQLASA